jgi:folylpolyglutamate synthase/dihydropteroate synthase
MAFAKRFIEKKFGKKADAFILPEAALEKALSTANPKTPIVVTGSFFLCGDLRNYLKKCVSG